MKILTLIFFLLCTYCISAQDSEQHDEYQKWINGFNDYLITHDNPNLSMTGLYHRLNDGSVDDDSSSYIEGLEKLLNYEVLTPQSLFIASSICHLDSVKESCPHELLNEQLQQVDSQNLLAYYSALELAIQTNNGIEISRLIKLMAQTKFSNFYFSNSKFLNKTIDDYVLNYPTSPEMLMKLFFGINELPGKLVTSIEGNPEVYQAFIVKTIYKFSTYLPAFKTLLDTCKNDEKLYKNCLKIADILSNNGHSIIAQMIGYQLKPEIFKRLDLPKKQKQAELEKNNFRVQYKCIINTLDVGKHGIEENLNYEMLVDIERYDSELAYYIELAKLNYNQLLSEGNENAIDPQTCFN